MKPETIGLLLCLAWIVLIAVRLIVMRLRTEDGWDAPRRDHKQAQILAEYADSQTRSRSEHLLRTLEANGRDE